MWGQWRKRMDRPNIPLHPVTSSAISHVGHDPLTNTLAVRFPRGVVYHVPGVTAGEAQRFLQAPSLGRHYQQFFAHRGQKAG